jgi:hypothetical protein
MLGLPEYAGVLPVVSVRRFMGRAWAYVMDALSDGGSGLDYVHSV